MAPGNHCGHQEDMVVVVVHGRAARRFCIWRPLRHSCDKRVIAKLRAKQLRSEKCSLQLCTYYKITINSYHMGLSRKFEVGFVYCGVDMSIVHQLVQCCAAYVVSHNESEDKFAV
jgi:hypothetical protein